jgi:hypothetical protein
MPREPEQPFIIFFGVKGNKLVIPPFQMGKFTPQEISMKKISYVLAALATIVIAAPAVAQDKPMRHEGMHRGMHQPHHRMEMHRHHHMMRHMMKREGM